ncbi:MAG TPA: thioredoxin domain-containing protein [Solirubrobacteraceae bacterium]|jgi:protein-disulfide isomerase
MASRAEQKAAARAAREARLKAASQVQARNTRLIRLATLVGAVALVIVVIIVAVGGGSGVKSYTPKQAQAIVSSLLAGIPQNGNVLGNPNAPITLTEYGDLVCPICRDFALAGEDQAIRHEVRQGKVKLVYSAMETASASFNGGQFAAGQVAARAAGVQHKEWNYILLWYYEQKSETTPYVTNSWIQNIALQIPGLNLAKWQADRSNSTLGNEVQADQQAVQQMVVSKQIPQPETPTLIFKGPKGTLQPIQSVLDYTTLKKAFKLVT